MLTNDKSTYKQLQSFNDIQALNDAVNAHKRNLSSSKLKNVRAVLQLIAQHSCVYIGVSYLSQKSIAEKLNISYKTVQRAIDKLVEIGAVVKYACKRAGGDRRQTSNIIVIQPIKQTVQPEMSSHKAESIKLKNINNTTDTKKADNAEQADKEKLIKDGLVTKLPQVLQRSLAPFFDADKVYELAGVVFKAKSAIDRSIRLEDYEQDYYKAILSVINAFKRGRVYNLPALIYHAVKTTTRDIKASEQVSLFRTLVCE